MGSIPTISIGTSNTTIPVLGFGTAASPMRGSETMKQAILEAIKLGYTHFDTAAIYGTEQCLGEAIAEALELQLVKSREELFVTSKLWLSDAHPDRVIPALQSTLKRLGLEYIDLYLIHFPASLKSVGYDLPINKKDLVAMDFKSVWEAMEECHRLGLSRNIGVSNFTSKKLQQLLLTSKIPPAVNQVEMSPIWQQEKLRKFCEEKGIHITAFSTLGATGTGWVANLVLDCEVLKVIAKARGKTVAQVCLRWMYEQGVSFVVKSFNKQRMKENLGIFDWVLSPEESQKIKQIPQQRGYLGHHFMSEDGPYTCAEDIWDDEI